MARMRSQLNPVNFLKPVGFFGGAGVCDPAGLVETITSQEEQTKIVSEIVERASRSGLQRLFFQIV